MSERGQSDALSAAVQWVAEEIVANEIRLPLPEVLRPLIAEEMVSNPFLGWPDRETADAQLDDWHWVPLGRRA